MNGEPARRWGPRPSAPIRARIVTAAIANARSIATFICAAHVRAKHRAPSAWRATRACGARDKHDSQRRRRGPRLLSAAAVDAHRRRPRGWRDPRADGAKGGPHRCAGEV
jgi:uncharacterized protein (DUF3084 family)